MFVGDVAEDLFKDVFEGNQTGDATEFVDDEGHVAAGAAERFHELQYRFGFGYDFGLPQKALDVELGRRATALIGAAALLPDAEEIFGIDDTDHVLRTALIDGHAGVLVFVEGTKEVVEVGLDGGSGDGTAGSHDFAGGEFAEVEEAGDCAFLGILEKAVFARGADDELDLFGGVGGGLRFTGESDGAGDDGGGAFDDGDEGSGNAREEEQGGGDEDSEAVGLVDGEVFGDDLADDDVHVGDEQEREGERDGMEGGGDLRGFDGLNDFQHEGVDGVFAGPTETKAGERNADLDDAKEAFRVGEQAEGGVGAGCAFIGQLAEARLAYGKECNLGAGEEAIQRDDEGNKKKSVS